MGERNTSRNDSSDREMQKHPLESNEAKSGTIELKRFKLEPRSANNEIVRPVELREKIWQPNFALLVISGKGSVGNTSTADFAAELYGIPQEQVLHAGEVFRNFREKSDTTHPEHDSVSYIDRPEYLDKVVDELIIQKIMETSVNNPMIIEAKLGGVLLRYLEQQARASGVELPAPRASILKWADSRKRIEIARKKKGTAGLPATEIRRQSTVRDTRDRERWLTIHPWLSGYTNILEKSARDDEGNPIYLDFVDASDHTSAIDDLYDLNEKLVRVGLVVEKPQEMQANQSITLK